MYSNLYNVLYNTPYTHAYNAPYITIRRFWVVESQHQLHRGTALCVVFRPGLLPSLAVYFACRASGNKTCRLRRRLQSGSPDRTEL